MASCNIPVDPFKNIRIRTKSRLSKVWFGLSSIVFHKEAFDSRTLILIETNSLRDAGMGSLGCFDSLHLSLELRLEHVLPYK